MNVTFWGNPCWKFLFSLTTNYPDEIKSKEDYKLKECYYNFFLLLQYLLPCKYCRESYSIFIKRIPINDYLDSKIHLTYWLYLIKNEVNKKLLKQEIEKQLKKNKGNLINKEKIQQIYKKYKSPPFIDVVNYYDQFIYNPELS
jgi:hypothetical protein